MSAQPVQTVVTPEAYLALERATDVKSEYISGEMIAMSGTSSRHEIILVNLTGLTYNALRGKPCRPIGGSVRVRVRATNYLYPDLTIVCGKMELVDDAFQDTYLNPSVIFEIISDSTEFLDRGIKWQLYQKIESLNHYVLISQKAARIEVYTRQSDTGWLLHVEEGLGGRIELAGVDASFGTTDVYEDIDFDPDSNGQ